MPKVAITWLGHSTFHIKLASGETILIDPWLEGNPSHPKGFRIDRLDLLLVTHGHFDHIADAVGVAKEFKPTVVANYEVGSWLGSKGVENLSPMNKGGTQTIGIAGGLKVTMTQAQHSSSIEDNGQTIYGGEPAGYVVGLPDGRAFYHAGDTCVFSDMQLIRELYRPELAMLPIGDHFTMGPREAALACRFLKPAIVMPMHYGTFPLLTGTPDALKRLLADQPETEVVAPAAGQPYMW
jgi:L-ascorbate metabolism protein UlaG (beta-lactamase superfamily)